MVKEQKLLIKQINKYNFSNELTHNMKGKVIRCHKKEAETAKNKNSYIELEFAYGKFQSMRLLQGQ